MAHQSSTIPIRNTRPNSEETMPRVLPAPKPATTKDIYQSSFAAAESSFRAAQRKASSAAASLTRTVRRFADERPLHFVGVVAGIALVAGAALRIWRTKRHA